MFEFCFGRSSEKEGLVAAIMPILPHIIWAAVVFFILRWIGRGTILGWIDRVEKVNVGGFELALRSELRDAAKARGVADTDRLINSAARRIAKSKDLIKDATILWVDDNPSLVETEQRILRDAGASICQAASTPEALRKGAERTFDVVVSDMKRGNDDAAGISLINSLRGAHPDLPVILYVGKVEGSVPLGAFGITDSPNELLHLVMDVLARQRS